MTNRVYEGIKKRSINSRQVQLIPLLAGFRPRLLNVYYVTCFMYEGIRPIVWLGLPYKYTPGLGLSFIVMFMTAPIFILCSLGRFADMQVGKKIYITTCKLAQMKKRCLTTSPSLTRYSGQSILFEPGKWFAFLNKRPQRGELATVEMRSEPYDETEI